MCENVFALFNVNATALRPSVAPLTRLPDVIVATLATVRLPGIIYCR